MFRLYNNNVIVKHNSFSLAVQKLTQINVFSLFDAVIYSNSYLDCYKKHNSFELNKIVILKTFDTNVWVLFRETYIRFEYKSRETCSETFFRTVSF